MAEGGRDDKPVSKAEFVGLMTLLGLKDRSKYRVLREIGWEAVIAAARLCKSDNPN